jgi:hypothetical protein
MGKRLIGILAVLLLVGAVSHAQAGTALQQLAEFAIAEAN